MKTMTIRIPAEASRFQEDKDLAKTIRLEQLLPRLREGRGVILDFADVEYATQSFIHALIGEALKQYGEAVLDRIEFRHCSSQLRNVIELVVNYSLGGFSYDLEAVVE
jgi:hypothetical protein